MTRPQGTTVAAIERLLFAQGPLAALELAREIGLPRDNVQPVVRRMMLDGPRVPRRVYIAGWTVEVEGSKPHLRALYALGNQPDKKKPKAKPPAQVQRELRARKRGRALNSVFNIGNRKL